MYRPLLSSSKECRWKPYITFGLLRHVLSETCESNAIFASSLQL